MSSRILKRNSCACVCVSAVKTHSCWPGRSRLMPAVPYAARKPSAPSKTAPCSLYSALFWGGGGFSLTWGYPVKRWTFKTQPQQIMEIGEQMMGIVYFKAKTYIWGKRSMHPNARFFIFYFNEVGRSCKACLFWPISECSEAQAPPHSFLVCRKVPTLEQDPRRLLEFRYSKTLWSLSMRLSFTQRCTTEWCTTPWDKGACRL